MGKGGGTGGRQEVKLDWSRGPRSLLAALSLDVYSGHIYPNRTIKSSDPQDTNNPRVSFCCSVYSRSPFRSRFVPFINTLFVISFYLRFAKLFCLRSVSNQSHSSSIAPLPTSLNLSSLPRTDRHTRIHIYPKILLHMTIAH